MKRTRHRYHYSVRWCKKNKQQIQRQKLAENVGDTKQFWTALKKINPTSKQISDTIGTSNSPDEITEVFYQKYKTLYNSVPTSDSELCEINQMLSVGLPNCNTSRISQITPELIRTCIAKLKPGKRDGSLGFSSDHLIHADKRLHILLSLLFKAIIIHGYFPKNLLLSTILSIPKDSKASLSNIDNYRGISLFNSISKVFDYVTIHLCDKDLLSSDMQFAYKERHSTVLCSIIYIETLHHYNNNGSNVFSCLLDASKAYDRIHYGKMFEMLLSRDLPVYIVRILFNCYNRQESRTTWNSCFSQYFTMSNGVKQGGVLSGILFTLYIDKLLLLLKKSGVGCYINGSFTGAISYADDITLSCPSIRGLNKMLAICNTFAKEHHLIFNAKKTLGIKYGDPVTSTEKIYLADTVIKWVDKVRHLGNFINSDLSDKSDCGAKISHFIGYVNKLRVNFGHVQPTILCKLFKTFCCSFYGSPLWKYTSEQYSKLCTTWNVAVRKVLSLPYRTHTVLLGPLLRQPHIRHQLYIRDVRFIYNMFLSNNDIVKKCFSNAFYHSNSCIGEKLAFFRFNYGIDVTCHSLTYAVDKLRTGHTRLNNDPTVNNLLTLLSVRSENTFIEGFNNQEISDMIGILATE